jgi:glycosyltransferase involved in cell wall biosynthesis
MQLVLGLSPGGTERLVIELCRRLNHEMQSMVCCLDEPGAWATELTERGIPVVAMGRTPGFHPSLAFRLRDVMRTHAIEVVHCHHYTPYVYGVLAAALHRSVRVIFTEHGRLHGVGISTKRRLVNPVLAKWPARIFSVSRALKFDMVREGFPDRAITVLYNGIEVGAPPQPAERAAMRQALGIPAESTVIGTVGRLDPVKNLGLLLEARALLGDRLSSTRIVIVGDGPERQALVDRAAALGISDVTHFTGHRADAREVMSTFDVYANCSTYEGVSLTILEAMAAALPVVATRVGGNPEVVVDGETGVLIPVDARGLAAAISRLAENYADRQVMGAAGRRRAERDFTIQRMVSDYALAYQGLPGSEVNHTAPAPSPAPAACESSAARPIGRDPMAN